jgi:Tol biopolymer transport system component
MRLQRFVALTAIAIAPLQYAAAQSAGNKDHLPHLPGALLLVGDPPEWLTITTGSGAFSVQADNLRDGSSFPSLSRDGEIIASARPMANPTDGGGDYLIVATFSTKTRHWTDYPNLTPGRGDIAISPDGSRLAFVGSQSRGSPWRLRILDRETGQITEGPVLPLGSGSIGMSWSPDNRRVAFAMPPSDAISSDICAIYILDTETGAISEVGLGRSPAWSPSGEWIAFVSYIPETQHPDEELSYADKRYSGIRYGISLVTPEEKNESQLTTFKTWVVPVLLPLWSPDSRSLLFNKSRDPDMDTFDAFLIDLATRRETRIGKGTVPVFGWAPDR